MIYIIGDYMTEYDDAKYIIRCSSLLRLLEKDPCDDCLTGMTFSLGQGLNAKEKEKLIAWSQKDNLFQLNISLLPPEDLCFVHKRKVENVLISPPQSINETEFVSELVIDDDCAETSDHVTGYHLSGMLLIEAVRQIMLSVSERYVFDARDSDEMYCVLHSMNVCYHSFTFPVGVSIKFLIKEMSKKGRNKYLVRSVSEVSQLGVKTATIEIDFGLYAKKALIKKEKSIFDCLGQGPALIKEELIEAP